MIDVERNGLGERRIAGRKNGDSVPDIGKAYRRSETTLKTNKNKNGLPGTERMKTIPRWRGGFVKLVVVARHLGRKQETGPSKPGSAVQMGCTDPAIGYRQIKSAPIGVLGVLAGNTESQVRGQTVGKGIERFK